MTKWVPFVEVQLSRKASAPAGAFLPLPRDFLPPRGAFLATRAGPPGNAPTGSNYRQRECARRE